MIKSPPTEIVKLSEQTYYIPHHVLRATAVQPSAYEWSSTLHTAQTGHH